MPKKPLICVSCNIIDYGGMPAHAVRDTYIKALAEIANCAVLLIPAMGKDFTLDDIAEVADGIVLTGSPSHVAPACYGAEQTFDNKYIDHARDETALPLILRAIEKDVPLLAICRGFQEMNIAHGGTLHQRLDALPDKSQHRDPEGRPLKEVYETQAHKVLRQKGGLLEKIGLPAEFLVNTVHQQGADKIGAGLFVEAMADDGLVEAISVPGKRFALGTQWHPEADYHLNPTSKKIFEAFGAAVRA